MPPWFTDDAAMMGFVLRVVVCFKLLIKLGPMFEYYPEPSKSIRICPLADKKAAKDIFYAFDLPVGWSQAIGTLAASWGQTQCGIGS